MHLEVKLLNVIWYPDLNYLGLEFLPIVQKRWLNRYVKCDGLQGRCFFAILKKLLGIIITSPSPPPPTHTSE